MKEGPATTVLVVEDETLIRVDIAEALRIAGFVVLEAASADDALDYLATGTPVDVVMTDIQMPGNINGLGLARIVLERFRDLPVVLTSANQPVDALDLPFIAKPYHEGDVVAALRGALNGRIRIDGESGRRKRGDGGRW